MTQQQRIPPTTGPQRALLAKLARGGFHLRGVSVHIARNCQRLGLLTLTDDGDTGDGNRSGERWSAVLTDDGHAVAALVAPLSPSEASRTGERMIALLAVEGFAFPVHITDTPKEGNQ